MDEFWGIVRDTFSAWRSGFFPVFFVCLVMVNSWWFDGHFFGAENFPLFEDLFVASAAVNKTELAKSIVETI
jgi:hypothetical protein